MYHEMYHEMYQHTSSPVQNRPRAIRKQSCAFGVAVAISPHQPHQSLPLLPSLPTPPKINPFAARLVKQTPDGNGGYWVGKEKAVGSSLLHVLPTPPRSLLPLTLSPLSPLSPSPSLSLSLSLLLSPLLWRLSFAFEQDYLSPGTPGPWFRLSHRPIRSLPSFA